MSHGRLEGHCWWRAAGPGQWVALAAKQHCPRVDAEKPTNCCSSGTGVLALLSGVMRARLSVLETWQEH